MRIAYIKQDSEAAEAIAAVLLSHLRQGQAVLWVVPGGSSIRIAAAASQQIPVELRQLLTVTLTDERYGEVGHADSNWQQLIETGFAFEGMTAKPVLVGADRTETTRQFAATLQAALQSDAYKIGFFGIGSDGHTAGILPGSPAVAAEGYAADYDAAAYQRITMTFAAIRQLDEAMIYAVGDSKWPIIEQLQATLPLNDQPAQILKQVPQLTIYTDYKGDIA